MRKKKTKLDYRTRGWVELQLERYWQERKNVEQYWKDNIPSPTPTYTDCKAAGNAGRKTENTALHIGSMEYVTRVERSCKAIERVLKTLDETDTELIRMVYWRSYKVERAAQELHMSKATAHRHINAVLFDIAVEMGYIAISV